jgi:hypothetical protein
MKERRMDRKIKSHMQTLTGVVTPYAWDENGNVSDVSLSATDDEEYVIENGFGFLSLLQQPIQATGIVKSGKKIPRMIDVKKYEVLDNDTPFGHLVSEPDQFDYEPTQQRRKGRHRHEKKRSRLFPQHS